MMREARHFFDTMQRMDVLPNHFSFNSLIAACTRAGAIDEAFLVIDTPHLHATSELLEQPVFNKGPKRAAQLVSE